MATHPDYYSILGVKKAAAPEEIRKAYKKLARKFHPDANPDDATTLEKFKQIQAAWAVLGDEKKRSNFDKYGTPDEPRSYDDRSQAGEGPRSWSAESGEVPFDIEELFGSFGGGRPGGSHRTHRGDWAVRGHDIRTQIQVPFQMAAEGGTYELRLQRDDGSPPETLAIAIPAGIDTAVSELLSRRFERCRATFHMSHIESKNPCCVTIRAEGSKMLGILRGFSKNPPCSVTFFNKGGGLAINRPDQTRVPDCLHVLFICGS